MSDVPLKPSFLHRFWSKKCASHFCRETTNKNIQFSKWETWVFNASDKALKGMLWISIYLNSFLNLLVLGDRVQMLKMQCNVECRLPEEDLIFKDPPPLRVVTYIYFVLYNLRFYKSSFVKSSCCVQKIMHEPTTRRR